MASVGLQLDSPKGLSLNDHMIFSLSLVPNALPPPFSYFSWRVCFFSSHIAKATADSRNKSIPVRLGEPMNSLGLLIEA